MSQGAWSEPGLQSASNQELEVAMKGNHTCDRSLTQDPGVTLLVPGFPWETSKGEVPGLP